MQGGISRPDPFIIRDGLAGDLVWKVTNGVTLRTQVIDPTKKTLVLISAGQSQWTSIMPTLYIPTNTSMVDNFNVYDGASYSIATYLLGCTQSAPTFNKGNILCRLADTLITNGYFDRVILVPLAITGSLIGQWATGGPADDRLGVAIRRLKSRGLLSATGLTTAFLWGQGEGDGASGTSAANYTARFADVYNQVVSNGFVGRTFVCQETTASGVSYPIIRNAQAALVNNTTIFSGGNLDTLGAGSRIADGTHFNDAGATSVAALVSAAMHASGSPF